MNYRNRYDEEPVDTEIYEGHDYTKAELNAISDELLRQDARAELCRECNKQGEKTGKIEQIEQDAKDADDHTLVIAFEEYECPDGHIWFEGEGKMRGIGGDNPILFEEHFQSRRRREIYTSIGTPDPSIVQGIYNRIHPQGRKVNSPEQRKKNGASWYR